MNKHKRVIYIIPTYNEKENIEATLKLMGKIASKNREYEFLTLVVDDSSPDGTGEIVKSYQKNHKNVHLLTGKKEGLGKAMIKGLSHAIEKLKADIVITNEADFSFDPNKIPYMLEKIDEGFDFVVASRHTKGGKTKGWTVARRFNHWAANYFFATLVAGNFSVSDHNGAFRAMRVKGLLDKVNLRGIKIKGFGFFNYLLFRLTAISDSYYEFPVTYNFRTKGESKVSFNPKYLNTYIHDIAEYIITCFKIRMEKH